MATQVHPRFRPRVPLGQRFVTRVQFDRYSHLHEYRVRVVSASSLTRVPFFRTGRTALDVLVSICDSIGWHTGRYQLDDPPVRLAGEMFPADRQDDPLPVTVEAVRVRQTFTNDGKGGIPVYLGEYRVTIG